MMTIGRRDRVPFAISNVDVATGDLDGNLLRDMTVVVAGDGRIEQVGPAASVVVPSGYRIIDGSGKVVAPGLINAHTHLFAQGKLLAPKKKSIGQIEFAMKLIQTSLFKSLSFARAKANAKVLLYSGVTTIRSLGGFAYEDVAVRDEVNADETVGPRILASGPMLSIPGGHGDPFITLSSCSPEQARNNAQINLDHGVNSIKVVATGGVTDATRIGVAGAPELDEESMRLVCDVAHNAGVIVAAHAQSADGVKAALRAGVDTIEHGCPLDDELAELFLHNPNSLRGCSGLNPTISAGLPLVELRAKDLGIDYIVRANSEMVTEGMLQGARDGRKYGVPVGVGTDTGMTLVTQYSTWRELDFMVRFAGFTPAEAFHAATQVNAQNLGIDDITGSVSVGKDADLIVLDGDPAVDVHVLENPRLVVSRGWPVWRPKVRHLDAVDRMVETI